MKKLLALLVCMAGFTAFACTGEDRPITREELPAKAQQLIVKYFDGVQIAYVTEDMDVLTKSYNVFFVNGDKLEFAKRGDWTDVDCKHSAVPTELIPTSIKSYLERIYPTAVVKKLEHNKRGYEVTLDNGFEIKFNDKFQVVEMDD